MCACIQYDVYVACLLFLRCLAHAAITSERSEMASHCRKLWHAVPGIPIQGVSPLVSHHELANSHTLAIASGVSYL